MLLKDVYKLYESYYNSQLVSERMMASGFLEIIDLYKDSKKEEIFEEVKLSLIAEEYYELMSSLWKDLKIEKYKFHAIAANSCIIKYATIEEIIKELKYFKGERSIRNYINYIKLSKLKGRVKRADLLSVYDLEEL